jgi:predicted RNase H-like nuclease (RuvC/YqgF family)
MTKVALKKILEDREREIDRLARELKEAHSKIAMLDARLETFITKEDGTPED